MITIHAPDPHIPWKPGDLVIMHLRVASVDGGEHVLEAADVIRRDELEQTHAKYHAQIADLSANHANVVERIQAEHAAQLDQRDARTVQAQERYEAELAAKDEEIANLHALHADHLDSVTGDATVGI